MNKTKPVTKGMKPATRDKRRIALVTLQSPSSDMEFKGYCRTYSRSTHDEAPVNRKKFEGDWDELKYLYYKILHWYYDRKERRQALEFRDRFEKVLKKLTSRHPEAIFVEECWSVLYELDRELDRAIEHRETRD